MFKHLKVAIFALFLVMPISALAMTGYTGQAVTLGEDQTINGNYYAAGSTVEVFGTVNGDVFVAGENIIIDSTNIHGDVFVAGSNIIIKGVIDGSVRMAGENMDVSAEIVNNIMAAGKSLRIDQDAKLAGHLTFWGQVANVSGKVDGRLEGAMETLRVNGSVGQDIDVYVSTDREGGIYFSDDSQVVGTVYYKSLRELEFNPNAEIGGVSFNKMVKEAKPVVSTGILLGLLMKFFGMLIVGMIGLYLWPKFFVSAYDNTYKKPVKYLGKGLLLLVGTPIAAVLVAITMIGVPLALLIMGLWILALYLGSILAAWLMGKFAKDKMFGKQKWNNLAIMALGVFLFILFKHIPIIGWAIVLVVYLSAWGTFINLFKKEK